MKKKHNLTVFVIILALVAGLLYMQDSARSTEPAPTVVDALKATVAGIELAYPANYGVYEKTNSPVTKTLSTVVWYENTESNKSFFTGGANAPSEPPVTMSLDVYSNPSNLSPKELLGNDAAYMFAKSSGAPVVVGGIQGTLLEWDGLYKGKSVMVNHKGLLYVFSMTSITNEDAIISDFDLLISSIIFK